MSHSALRTRLAAISACTAILAFGVASAVNAGTLPEAGGMAAKVAPSLGAALEKVRAPRSELVGLRTIAAPIGGGVLRIYEQRIDGHPVLNSKVAVTSEGPPSADSAVITDSTRGALDPAAKPGISSADAVAAAAAPTPVSALRVAPAPKLVVDPAGGGTLAYSVTVTPADASKDSQVVVSAADGSVLSRQSLVHDAKKKRAKIYLANPVEEQNGYSQIKDRGDRNSARLTKLRKLVGLKRLAAGRCLKGRWAEGRVRSKSVCKKRRNWAAVKRHDDRFEALMAYYHVDREQAYIHDTLGFKGSSKINDRRQVVIADQKGLGDNSFYSGGDRMLHMGAGGIDDAEDGNVIAHEYGHSIQDNQVPGFGTSQDGGAIGEGFGDYMAAVMSSTFKGASNEDSVCIFDWDGIPYTPFTSGRKCGRRADIEQSEAQLTVACGGFEIHCVGQAWSTALWDIRKLYSGKPGKRYADKVVLLSQFLYPKNTSFSQAAFDIECADEFLQFGSNSFNCNTSPNFAAYESEFNFRGW